MMTVLEVFQQAQSLTWAERKELLKLLLDTLDAPPSSAPRHLSELRGLGKEIWTGIDAQIYVSELRDEWSDVAGKIE
jgi:hypothetical protein